METKTHLWSFVTRFFLTWEMVETEVVEKYHNPHFTAHNIFYPHKSSRLFDNVENNVVQPARQATDDSMTHALCTLDN